MRFNYSPSAHTPELIVPAVIAGLESSPVLDFDAKIDTGADITVVPAKVRALLGIKPAAWATSSGALGQKWTRIPRFYVRIRVAGTGRIETKVTESSRDYLLLGRDILNRCILTANGPAGWFDLGLPAT